MSVSFTAYFAEENIVASWNITILPEYQKYFEIEQVDNQIKIKALDNADLIGSQIKLELRDENNIYYAELYVKVVSLIYG